jgi:cystathionine beta-lyase
MQYDFDQPIERRGGDSEKWNTYPGDVLPLWVADMDFRSPEPVIRALADRVAQGVFGYPSPKTVLCETIAERLNARYAWQVSPEEIVLIPGVIQGFNRACHVQSEPGGNVLVQTPVYPPFLKAPGNAGLERRENRLICQDDGAYAIDFDDFEARLDDQTRLFILCNPHNPVGRVFRRDELERMAAACLQRGVLICSDEIHCDLVFPGAAHLPIASLAPEIARNTITLMAPSKTFNLPGLYCSFAVIQNDSLRRRFLQAGQGLTSHVNVLGLAAAQAAYREGQDWLDQALVYLQANRDLVVNFVREQLPGIQAAAPQATYLAWLDCRQSGIQGNPGEFFLERGRVALADGAKFGACGQGFVRLNFGCRRAVLAEGLERMCDALTAG